MVVQPRGIADRQVDLEDADAIGPERLSSFERALRLFSPVERVGLGQLAAGQATDQIVKRPPQRLPLQVPQCEFNPGAGGLAARTGGTPAGYDRLRVEWVPPDERRTELRRDRLRHRLDRLTGVVEPWNSLAVARQALIG